MFANMQAVLEQIFTCMKTKMSSEQNTHRIRVTKVYIKVCPSWGQEEAEELIYCVKIISTNKVSKELVESLELDAAVWCLNPLIKYFKET